MISATCYILIFKGPPGTGKTSAILGMVSALLHRNTDSMTSPSPTSTSTSTSSAISALSGVEVNGGDGVLPENKLAVDGSHGKKQRLLLCAPSNAAVDELLLRLLKGVYNSHGILVVVKVLYFTIILNVLANSHVFFSCFFSYCCNADA